MLIDRCHDINVVFIGLYSASSVIQTLIIRIPPQLSEHYSIIQTPISIIRTEKAMHFNHFTYLNSFLPKGVQIIEDALYNYIWEVPKQIPCSVDALMVGEVLNTLEPVLSYFIKKHGHVHGQRNFYSSNLFIL